MVLWCAVVGEVDERWEVVVVAGGVVVCRMGWGGDGMVADKVVHAGGGLDVGLGLIGESVGDEEVFMEEELEVGSVGLSVKRGGGVI